MSAACCALKLRRRIWKKVSPAALALVTARPRRPSGPDREAREPSIPRRSAGNVARLSRVHAASPAHVSACGPARKTRASSASPRRVVGRDRAAGGAIRPSPAACVGIGRQMLARVAQARLRAEWRQHRLEYAPAPPQASSAGRVARRSPGKPGRDCRSQGRPRRRARSSRRRRRTAASMRRASSRLAESPLTRPGSRPPLHRADRRPVGAALVELVARAAVHGDQRDARPPRPCAPVPARSGDRVPAEPHLHASPGDRPPRTVASISLQREIGIAHQRRAGMAARDRLAGQPMLMSMTARPALRPGAPPRPSRRIAAGDLHDVDVRPSPSAAGAFPRRRARNRRRRPFPTRPGRRRTRAQAPHPEVGDPGHGREHGETVQLQRRRHATCRGAQFLGRRNSCHNHRHFRCKRKTARLETDPRLKIVPR